MTMLNWNTFQTGSAALDAETAQRWLDQVTAACSTLDIDLIVDVLTEDAVADLGPVVIQGRENLRPVLRERYAKYTHFDLEKKLCLVSGDVIVCDVRLRWKSADQQGLQHTRALEILQVRDGRIARWDNASISWADPQG